MKPASHSCIRFYRSRWDGRTYHLHEFKIEGRRYGEPDPDYDSSLTASVSRLVIYQDPAVGLFRIQTYLITLAVDRYLLVSAANFQSEICGLHL